MGTMPVFGFRSTAAGTGLTRRRPGNTSTWRPGNGGGQGIIRSYVAIVAVTTFAQALIWGVNTLLLLDAGLDIFEVMVANAALAAGQVLFEVPTGVVADTLGRLHDLGFARRRFRISRLCEETRTMAKVGIRLGVRNRVVLPLMLAGLVQGVFFMYGYCSWQRYFLHLLGRDLVRVSGIIAGLVGLSRIVGAALVGPLSRTRLRRSTIVFAMVAVQSVVVVAAALVQAFWVAVPLYLMSTLAYGIQQPVRQAWLNAHIPSAQRASIISLDAMFLETGGAGGQVGLGYLSRAVSIPAAWVVGGSLQLAALPFIWRCAASLGRGPAGGRHVARAAAAGSQPPGGGQTRLLSAWGEEAHARLGGPVTRGVCPSRPTAAACAAVVAGDNGGVPSRMGGRRGVA